MPYIKKEKRKDFDYHIASLTTNITCEGDINYIISALLHLQLINKGLNYQNINNLIGVLECAKLELYQVIAAPYENKKRAENGSVSKLDEV